MEMIQSNKGLESKQLEMHKEQHSTDKKKLAEALNQLAKLQEGIDERDRAIASLQEVQYMLTLFWLSESIERINSLSLSVKQQGHSTEKFNWASCSQHVLAQK